MLDQYNLFDTPENHTADTPFHTVVTPSSNVKKDTTKSLMPDSNPAGLWAFAMRESRRMWQADDHRKRSLSQLQRFLDFHPDYKTFAIGDFKVAHIDAFIDALLDEGLGHSSVNRYSATISKVFHHAVKKKELDSAFRLTFYTEKDRNRVRVYDNQELAQIKDWFMSDKPSAYGHVGSEWMWDMCIAASKGGMRQSEIVSVARPIRGVMSYLTPDELWLVLPPEVCKSKKGRKVAMSNPVLLEAIKRLQVSLQYVWSQKTFYRRWNKMRNDLFPDDAEAVFHAMRHTAASKMANELKMNTVVIAKALGHQSITTTEKYIHANDDALLEAITRM